MVEGQLSKRIRHGGETTELLISDAWSELSEEVASNLSKNVISLALSNGHTIVFACSGIAVARVECVTRFMTSASLVRALNDNKKDHRNLKIEVRYEDNVITGFLGEYNLCNNIAVVNVMTFPDVHVKLFNNLVDFLPCTKVVALGCGIAGKLMTTSGIMTGNSNEDLLTLSTCTISQVCKGGPLFYFDGNFVGMNLLSVKEGTIFLPMRILGDQLALCKSPEDVCLFICLPFTCPPTLLYLTSFYHMVGERLTAEMPDFYQEGDGMVLANTFEEPFGDIFDKGVWSKLSEKAVSNIRGSVVALASFNGKRRNFACTGFCIDWNGGTTILTSASLITNRRYGNKIDENLRIEVLLPSQERREGTLQHYNLQYNVALGAALNQAD